LADFNSVFVAAFGIAFATAFFFGSAAFFGGAFAVVFFNAVLPAFVAGLAGAFTGAFVAIWLLLRDPLGVRSVQMVAVRQATRVGNAPQLIRFRKALM
jgi:hypothetical protein